MNKTAFDPIVRAAALAAAFAVSACASAKPAAPPTPAKPAHAAPLAAAPSPAATPQSALVAMPTAPLTRIGGIVVSEDVAAHTLTIKDYSGRTRSFRIASDARFTKGGSDAAVGMDVISAGDRVRLKVGGDVAASVHVMVKPAQ